MADELPPPTLSSAWDRARPWISPPRCAQHLRPRESHHLQVLQRHGEVGVFFPISGHGARSWSSSASSLSHLGADSCSSRHKSQVLGEGWFPSSLRDWRWCFERLSKKFSHWGLDWGTVGELKSLKSQFFLIGIESWGTVGETPNVKELLKEEYKLKAGVKDKAASSFLLELESTHAVVHTMAKVRELLEGSYDMENTLDADLVRAEGSRKPNIQDSFLKRLLEMMTFKNIMEHNKVASDIENTMKHLQEVTEHRAIYADTILAMAAASWQTVNPQLTVMYREGSQIIGINKLSADLRSMLLPKGKLDERQLINELQDFAAVVVMPELEELEFSVSVEKLMENNISCEDLGLEHLPSIRKVKVDFWCGNVFEDDVEREEAALRHAIEIHPNRPILQIQHIGKKFLKSYDGMQPTGTSGTGHDQMRMNTPPLMQTCNEWILDTGAMEHCTSDQRLLPKNCRENHIGWIGSVETEQFKVPHVHYIPGAEMKNIISASRLADHGLEVVFEPACCFVRDPVTGKDVGLGQQRNGAYVLHFLLIGNPQDVLPSGSGAQELRDYGRLPRKLKWPDDANWFGRTRFGRAGYPTEDVFTGSSPHEQHSTRAAEFYIDSGVCHHITWNGDLLKPYHDSVQVKPPIESVTIGAEKIQSAVIMDQLPCPLKVAGIGYIDSTGGLLDRVLLVPDSAVNLVSVNQLTVDYSIRVVFRQDEFWIEKLESNERIGHGKRIGCNYVVAVLDPCDWVLDSSAWVHHTANRKILYNFQETAEHPQILGNGLLRTERFNVPGVHYIAGDALNVISVAQLADDHGLVTIFEPEFCYIKEKETEEIVGQGYLRDGVYVLNSLRLNKDKAEEQGAGEGLGRRDSGANERDRGQGGSGRDGGGSTGGEYGKKGGRGQGQPARGGSGGGSGGGNGGGNGGEKEDNEDKNVEGAEEEDEEEEEVGKEAEVVNEEIEEEREGEDKERENETVGDQPQESSQSEPPLFESSLNIGRAYFSCGLCIADSGATHHLTPHKDLLLLGSFYMGKENRKFPKNKVQAVLVAESKSLHVEGFGNLKKDVIKISDVLYVPKHAASLISVSQLVSQLSQQLEEQLQISEVARQLEVMGVPRLWINLVAHHLENMGVPKKCVKDFTSQVRRIGVTQELIGSLNDALRGMGLSQDGFTNLLVGELQPSGVHYNHQIHEIAKQLKNMSVPQLELDELAGQLEASCVQDILWIHKLGTHLLALNLMLDDLAPQLYALCVSLTPQQVKEFADQHEALRKPQLQFDRLAPLLQAMCVPCCWIQQLDNQLQALGVPQFRVDELASQLEATCVPQGFIDELTTHLGDMSMPQDLIKKVATELKDMGASQLQPDDLVDYLQTLGMQLQIEDVATSLRDHGLQLLQTNELARELQSVGAPWLLIDEIVRQIDAVGVVEQQHRVDELVANLRQPAGMDVQQHRLDYLDNIALPPHQQVVYTISKNWVPVRLPSSR